MFKWYMKKNPWFSCDQNAQKHQKPQISKSAKIPKKNAWNHLSWWKRKGKSVLP